MQSREQRTVERNGRHVLALLGAWAKAKWKNPAAPELGGLKSSGAALGGIQVGSADQATVFRMFSRDPSNSLMDSRRPVFSSSVLSSP